MSVFPLARFQRLHNDLRPIPAIAAAATGKREQYCLPTRQQLGTVRDLAFFHADEEFRLAAVR